MKSLKYLLLPAVALLISCSASDLQLDEEKSNERLPVGAAKPLSNDTFKKLSVEQQYQVANKLAGTLYKGVTLEDFFDLSAGGDFKVGDGKNFLAKMRAELKKPVQNKAVYSNVIELRHGLNETRKPTAIPLATIKELPISRDLFEAWMAYTLANTILFSPAEEIDSADYIDVHRVYSGLIKAMSEGQSIRDIILAHMKSQANWRRFRSPEDNTREMIEIYLGLFDRDEDVPKASIACKNWYLADDSGNYELIIDELNENVEPQYVLGQWVTSCTDFYEVVANHPLVIPRMVTFLVDVFFPNLSGEKRSALMMDIVATNPETFSEIFLAIIFSEEYLLRNERAKNFEETFFNLAERVKWNNERRFLDELTNPASNTPNLHKMKQPAMALKLGRFKDQPLDSLSFAYYHTAVRELLLVQADNRWGRWGSEFVDQGDYFGKDEFVSYLFMALIARKPSSEELAKIKEIIVNTENESNRSEQTRLVFDYISRLPELYYYSAIEGE
ncbi:MAG TPA: hypothetical protein ENK06_13895 [Gammaproteobacteria bacterium]|nr:hypothetical protein [Gammaproteobacteria bacterium]